MATLKARIEDYIGSFSDTDALNHWLYDGARTIIDLLPAEVAEILGTNENEPGTGVAVTGKRVLRARNNVRPARKIPAFLKEQAGTTTSIHYATANDPVYYVEGKAFVLPVHSTNNKVVTVAYPTADCTQTSISGFLSEYLDGVIIYASVRGAISLLVSSVASLVAPSISGIDVPDKPDDPAFVYTDPTLGTYTSTLVGSLGTEPSYEPPVFSGDYAGLYALEQSDEDAEIAQAQLGKMGIKINEYQTDIQNAIQKFNEENIVYQASIQKAIEDARLTQQRILQYADTVSNVNVQAEAKRLETQVAEYGAKLQKYQSDFNFYATLVQSELGLGAWNLQMLGTKLQNYIGLITQLKNEWIEFLRINFNIGEQNGQYVQN